MELQSDLHDTIKVSLPNKKRWHLAFATIYCSRAFLSRRKQISSNMKQILSEISAAIVIDVVPKQQFFSCVDQSSLTNLVKEKSLEQLAELGGIEGISTSLNTELQHGINGDHPEEIASRKEAFGTNTYQKQPTKSFFHFVWEAFKDPTILILLVCAALSLGFGMKENGPREGCMTGESDHVEIDQSKNPFLFSGTKVADGYAKMLVTSVGMNTFWGTMMSSISRDSDVQTPLQARLTKLTSSIGIIAAAVTIVVVAVPEGLPLAVTLTLAYSMKRMMADQAMVRKLSACETMGSATTMCSPTEKAILSWAMLELNVNMEVVKRGCNILHVEAFNSAKKRSGILMKKVEDDTFHVHWKGAAEMILAMCSHYYDLEGNMKALNDQERMTFDQIIQGMAARSLRCIAFAHKQVSEVHHDKKIEENELTLMGFVGLKDPYRPGVKKAVEDCQYAGVNVKMITGDNVFTAKAIATECGILDHNQEFNDGAVVEGVEFCNYTEEERMMKIDRIRVMARSSPFDKLLMVQCLKNKGHVVAVTGDGTNDAPALKEADIGLSMGIQGTEVAKESSDIVILDDNFASVATILRWGRCVYNNIQKFIQFQLTVNVAALAINFVAAVSVGEVPLTAVQLLWKPTKELMEKRPVGRTELLISNVMWRNLLAQALYQIAVLLTLQFKGESILGVSEKVNDTVIFNRFVLCQVFNEFNARKLEKKNVFEGIYGNKLFLGIIAATVVLQVVMVEFLKKFADTERLNWGQWGVCIVIAAASWPIGFLVKLLPVPERLLFSYCHLKNLRGM
ncbi:Calcium-transporting ATPase [Handroanthus impetiginosus]|uniref:P-type Ca(2+) transporter n=1 Tax=Handroanthus impetiginosus TaxID=429701 RepID=A0A2G9HAJ6_9LAMI|nr:Calcium-transporting ATPase [Handroanthus impetiginosus]